MSKKKDGDQGTLPPDDQNPITTPPDDQNPSGEPTSMKLKFREIDVRYNGRLIKVDQRTLNNDPELFAWLSQKHPDVLTT